MTQAQKIRRAEIRQRTRERKSLAAQTRRDLAALAKQADALLKQATKLASRHDEQDRILRRRIDILQSRL